MTDFEGIARLKLVVDNRSPRMPPRESTLQRVGYLAALIGAVALVIGFWWGVACLLLSLE